MVTEKGKDFIIKWIEGNNWGEAIKNEIAKRLWQEWVDYMNANPPDRTGYKYRVPPMLLDWLDNRED